MRLHKQQHLQMREKDLAMIENDFADRMVLILLVSIVIVSTLVWLWRLVTAENDNQQLYRVVQFTRTGTEVIKAGITFAEANELIDMLEKKNPGEPYGIANDVFAS
jgi:uncharacterized membrane protein (DUF106 family)